MNFRELPDITQRQKEILILIYRFRFINRHQLQRYFKHKDARRINTWLRDLVAKNYLGRIYSHKLLENTKPAIYYLNNNGIIWIRYRMGEVYRVSDGQLEMKYLKKFYQDKKASEIFINHCTAIFELFLQLKEADVEDKIEYTVETKTERWITKQLQNHRDEDIKEYIPDLFVEKMKNPFSEDIDSTTYFIELFDPHVPIYAIKYRVRQYIKLKEGENWNDYVGLDDKFPTVLLIFPHQQKINLVSKDIREMLERSYESEGLTILVTTHKKAVTQGIANGSKIWQQIKDN